MKRFLAVLTLISVLLSCSAVFCNAVGTDLIVSDEGRLPFEDVKPEYWYYDEVISCYSNGIVNGMNYYTYGSGQKLTRAQLVTMIANLEGADTSGYEVGCFTDVKSGHWYYSQVAWAYENGIVAGITPDKFAPHAVVDRQTMACMMNRYMESKGYEVEVNGDDMKPYEDIRYLASWASYGMNYMVSAGIITGTSYDELSPREAVTRAQVSRLMFVYMRDYLYGGHEHDFEAATCDTSSQCSICGMKQGLANGHRLAEYDCVTSGVCTVCGASVSPSKLLHDFVIGICTDPMVCSRCSESRKSNLKHTTNNGICGRCGADSFLDPKERLLHYFHEYTNSDPDISFCTTSVKYQHDNGDWEYLLFRHEGTVYYFEYYYVWADNTIGHVMFTDHMNEYTVRGFTASENLIFSGSGIIKPQLLTDSYDLRFEQYTGEAAYRAEYQKLSRDLMVSCMTLADELITDICGEGIEIFGFTNLIQG